MAKSIKMYGKMSQVLEGYLNIVVLDSLGRLCKAKTVFSKTLHKEKLKEFGFVASMPTKTYISAALKMCCKVFEWQMRKKKLSILFSD